MTQNEHSTDSDDERQIDEQVQLRKPGEEKSGDVSLVEVRRLTDVPAYGTIITPAIKTGSGWTIYDCGITRKIEHHHVIRVVERVYDFAGG